MFNFRRDHKGLLTELHEELRKSRQEREAARLGLMSAVFRLVREVQAFPLDEKVEMVADDLAAAGGAKNERS